MLAKHITTVLFDLDGTLLPMDQMGFTKTYFGLLVQKAAPFGLKPQPTIDAVWAGTKAMVKNDGSAPNDRRFWGTFCPLVGVEESVLRPVFDKFYGEEFHGAKAACGENPCAAQAVRGLKAQGYDVVLATNPIFPLVGGAHPALLGGPGPRGLLPGNHLREQPLLQAQPRLFPGDRGEAGQKTGGVPDGGQRRGGGHRRRQGGPVPVPCHRLLENGGKVDLAQFPHGSFRDFLSYSGAEG